MTQFVSLGPQLPSLSEFNALRIDKSECRARDPRATQIRLAKRLVSCYRVGMGEIPKNRHAVALGRKGGRKRWAGISAADRTTATTKAINARWARVRAEKEREADADLTPEPSDA